MFLKEFKIIFLPLKTWKKHPKKLLIIGPDPYCIGPAAETAQKQESRTTKSPLMQDWAFRLGLYLCIATYLLARLLFLSVSKALFWLETFYNYDVCTTETY